MILLSSLRYPLVPVDVQAGHEQERYKMQETMSQQAKLIDYLQTKVENPPKKKRGVSVAADYTRNITVQCFWSCVDYAIESIRLRFCTLLLTHHNIVYRGLVLSLI